jgi:hypothetical protein
MGRHEVTVFSDGLGLGGRHREGDQSVKPQITVNAVPMRDILQKLATLLGKVPDRQGFL